jgi:UDP-N-acetylglucosamine pyrophosphorylase
MPNLNQKGKIQLEKRDKLSMSSSGNGGFLKSLHKEGVLKILEKSKIELINVVETSDLECPLGEPRRLGLLLDGFECLVDVTKRTSTVLDFPTILQDDQARINCYAPNETLTAMKQDGTLFPTYKMMNLNCCFTMAFLKRSLKEHPAEVFKYRPRKRDVKIYNRSLNSTCIDGGLSFFSFELNIFNLVRLCKRVLLVERDEEEMVVMINEPGAPNYTEKQALALLKEKYDEFTEKSGGNKGKACC